MKALVAGSGLQFHELTPELTQLARLWLHVRGNDSPTGQPILSTCRDAWRFNVPRFIAAGFRAQLIGLSALAVLASADCGAGASSWRVHPDGRIGHLEIDASTEADVRNVAGTPFKIERVSSPTKKRPVGYELYYRCGRSCVTVYAISYATRRLADFVTQSPLFVSERGSHVGMSAIGAAAIEHREIVGACGEGHAIYLRSDKHHTFALGVFAGRVSLITYLGPHTLSYEELC